MDTPQYTNAWRTPWASADRRAWSPRSISLHAFHMRNLGSHFQNTSKRRLVQRECFDPEAVFGTRLPHRLHIRRLLTEPSSLLLIERTSATLNELRFRVMPLGESSLLRALSHLAHATEDGTPVRKMHCSRSAEPPSPIASDRFSWRLLSRISSRRRSAIGISTSSHPMVPVLPSHHSSCTQFSVTSRAECRQVAPCRISSPSGTKAGTTSKTFFKLRALSFCFVPKGAASRL